MIGSVLKSVCVIRIRMESKECAKKGSLQQHAYLLTGTWTSPSSEKLTSDSVCPRTRGWPLSKQAWRNLTACRARVSTPNLLFCDYRQSKWNFISLTQCTTTATISHQNSQLCNKKSKTYTQTCVWLVTNFPFLILHESL